MDDLHWEFKLRQGVNFHDGSPFTAEDVKFSYERVRNLPNNPGTYASNISPIEASRSSIPTRSASRPSSPRRPYRACSGLVMIVSHTAAANASPPISAGRAAIGTGPFKFVEFRPGEALRVTRNEDYWGQRPAWQTRTFRIIPNDMRACWRSFQATSTWPSTSPSPTRPDRPIPAFHLYKRVSDRSVQLSLDAGRDRAPGPDRQGGRPAGQQSADVQRPPGHLDSDQPAAHCRTADGRLRPAREQFAPEGLTGFNPELPVQAFDPAGARKLLAEAGYPDGFGLVITAPTTASSTTARSARRLAR